MTKWLKCRVENGMFSDERAVIVHRRGNGSIEFFVPENYVKNIEGQGTVQVRVFRRDDGFWAELPTPFRDSVPIEEAQVIAS